MLILLEWSVRLKNNEGPLALCRVISFRGFVELISVENAQSWLNLIRIPVRIFQWFDKSN